MTVNANLTVQRNCESASGRAAIVASAADNYTMKIAYEGGWAQGQFAAMMNEIETSYGEEALLTLLERLGITPVYSSAE